LGLKKKRTPVPGLRDFGEVSCFLTKEQRARGESFRLGFKKGGNGRKGWRGTRKKTASKTARIEGNTEGHSFYKGLKNSHFAQRPRKRDRRGKARRILSRKKIGEGQPAIAIVKNIRSSGLEEKEVKGVSNETKGEKGKGAGKGIRPRPSGSAPTQASAAFSLMEGVKGGENKNFRGW